MHQAPVLYMGFIHPWFMNGCANEDCYGKHFSLKNRVYLHDCVLKNITLHVTENVSKGKLKGRKWKGRERKGRDGEGKEGEGRRGEERKGEGGEGREETEAEERAGEESHSPWVYTQASDCLPSSSTHDQHFCWPCQVSGDCKLHGCLIFESVPFATHFISRPNTLLLKPNLIICLLG